MSENSTLPKYSTEHTQRLALIMQATDREIKNISPKVQDAIKKVVFIVQDFAQHFCSEAYKTYYSLEKICEMLDNVERNFNKVVYSVEKQDMRNVRAFCEYCKAIKDQLAHLPKNQPFTLDIITSLLDVMRVMQMMGCDALILPYL